MKVIERVADFKNLRNGWGDLAVGFVPTMGALHAGHLSLIERARAECDAVAVSLFVNPAQFNDPNDFEKYPRTMGRDLEMLREAGVHAAFVPSPEEIYADRNRFQVSETEMTKILCGPKRPGHFIGVLTVVLKLLNIVQPARAYFGEKDFQQLRLIQEMARAFFLNCEIVACPTVREADGLAMSSRNTLLNSAERDRAAALPRILRESASAEDAARRLTDAGFRVDYVEEHWGRRFGAAFLGSVRLIDNVEI
jgi:pantoate--beta-alanine ligase